MRHSSKLYFSKVESDLKRAEERAESGNNTYFKKKSLENFENYFFITGESKIVNLEEELRVIGENLKVLEVAEEKAQLREEEFKRQIKVISERLKIAESRLF